MTDIGEVFDIEEKEFYMNKFYKVNKNPNDPINIEKYSFNQTML